MELLQLRYFQTVAGTENITKAAAMLYVSQPALSAAISRLEKDIGVELFTRTRNRISLTEAGRCYLEYVNSALYALAEGEKEAKRLSSNRDYEVCVAASLGMIRSLAEEYRQLHQDKKIRVVTCDSDQIRHMLLTGEADIGINLSQLQDSRFTHQVLLNSRYFVAMAEDTPLAKQEVVSMKDLENMTLFCSNIAQTYEQATAIMHRAGCSCSLFRLDEKDVLFDAARRGLGAVFCLPMLDKYNKYFSGEIPGVVFLPIGDCEERGQVVLLRHKNGYSTQDVEDFVSYLTRRFVHIEETTNAELLKRGLTP